MDLDLKGMTHVAIPDTQVKPGVRTDHLRWIGQYIVDQFAGRALRVIHLGDHADMPSLSSYDKGTKSMEGRRYSADIAAANAGFAELCAPLKAYNRGRKKHRQWWPDRHVLLGNHENRINRAVEADPQLEGVISTDDLDFQGWTVHPFLELVELDGVSYSHYLYHPNTGRPYSGENLHTRLKQVGHSFTMGHKQGMNYAVRPVGKHRHHGLVCGSAYLHEEKYLGPQATAYWRGIVVCHQVENGQYDPMFVSLDYLCRRYEGKTLAEFLK
jgi:hypothetical protein